MSTPAERFIAEVQTIRAHVDALPEVAVRALLAEIETLRRSVAAEIVSAAPDTYQPERLRLLDARLRALGQAVADRYTAAVAGTETRAAALGQALTAEPLMASGDLGFTPQASRRQFEIARAWHASLISGAIGDTINAISSDLRAGLLRGASTFEIARQVTAKLDAPGPFGSLATRAEAITRTEIGRITALAQQASLTEAARVVPGLKKMWQHSGNLGRYVRTGHLEADGQVVAVDAPFRVRPSVVGARSAFELIQYPRDPMASPENSVFCSCVSLPWREDYAEALDEARNDFTRTQRERLRDNTFAAGVAA